MHPALGGRQREASQREWFGKVEARAERKHEDAVRDLQRHNSGKLALLETEACLL